MAWADIYGDSLLSLVEGNTGAMHRFYHLVHCSEGARAQPGSNACVACPLMAHRDTSIDVCYECTAGAVQGLAGKCQACPPGHERPLGAPACKTCPMGSAETNSSATCTLCHPGTYNAFTGSVRCFPCPLGAYARSAGAMSCAACGAGTYSEVAGSTSCTRCSAGGYCGSVAAASATVWEACVQHSPPTYPGAHHFLCCASAGGCTPLALARPVCVRQGRHIQPTEREQ